MSREVSHDAEDHSEEARQIENVLKATASLDETPESPDREESEERAVHSLDVMARQPGTMETDDDEIMPLSEPVSIADS